MSCMDLPFVLAAGLSESSAASVDSSAHTWGAILKDFWRDVLLVVEQKVWLLACGGYTLYVAVLGVYAYW